MERWSAGSALPKVTVLLARLVFAAAITALLLYPMRRIFLTVKTGIKVDFELRYDNRAGSHWQIFYKSSDGPDWERLPSERMDAAADLTKVSVLLPAKTGIVYAKVERWGHDPFRFAETLERREKIQLPAG